MAFPKGCNANHPKPGSQITVEPIRDLADISRIRQLLLSHPRDMAIFVLGINTNLRASDLVARGASKLAHALEHVRDAL